MQNRKGCAAARCAGRRNWTGGKVGIIKDPFGLKAETGYKPEYLGSTTPILNASIKDLSLSPDSNTLLGNINYWAQTGDPTPPSSGVLKWDLAALIKAANDHSIKVQNQALSRTIPFDREGSYAENIQILAAKPEKIDFGWVFGMANNITPPVVQAGNANYGDIARVDIVEAIRKALVNPSLKISGFNQANIWIEPQSEKYAELVTYTTADGETKLVSGAQDKNLLAVSAAKDASYTGEFGKEGVFFLSPQFTEEEMQALRAGERLPDRTIKIRVSGLTVDDAGEKKYNQSFVIEIDVKDFTDAAGRVFFGDRPTDDPGYTAFQLSGANVVSKSNIVDTAAEALDVWRVEQRLKYLAFPAMGSDTNGTPTLANNTIQDFKVDGVWERDESLAAYLFSNVISYTNYQRQLATPGARVNPHIPGQTYAGFGDTYSNRSAYFTTLYDTAKSFSIEQNGSFKYRAPDGTSTGTIVEWTSNPGDFTNYLNAYNAPHWMNVYQSLQGVQGLTVTSGMTPAIGTKPSREEMYGVSWARDLMVASAYADTNLQPGSIRFNGMVDANHGYTPFGHSTHDLGMAFDLGISKFITQDVLNFGQNDPHDTVTPQVADALAAVPTARGAWSLANAKDYSSKLPQETDPDSLNDQVTALRNFLSLYSVTQSDGWNAMTQKVVNGTQARDALFGSGTQNSDQLISKVIIGGTGTQNPYTNMRNVLNALGVGLDRQVKDHNSHFHVFLNTLAPVSFQNLLADNPSATQAGSSTPETLQAAAQELLDYTQTFITGDELMFTMDVPYIPAQETPIVLAQAATSGATTPQPDYILTSCKQTESTGDSRSAFRAVDPAALLEGYLGFRDHRPFSLENAASIKPILLEGTTHGVITPRTTNYGRTTFHYDPIPNYTGNDRAVFLAEFEGKVYKIIVNLVVSPTVGESPLMPGEEPVCPPPKLIKVNGKPVSGSLDFGSGYSLGSLSVTFADLDGGAVGQAAGEGANATITLDTTAAGHNWYIDTTPWDNSEYLPTSNPNEWVAKAGSDAAGKMDMLSVLLHEYGHALGIEHSADGHDYMGATLTVGVRRMPSAEEMALMQQLIGQAKGEMIANASTSTGGGQDAPFPTLPFSLGGLAFAGLLRPNRYGGTSIDFAGAPPPDTKYETAANATFTNLNTPAGWNTQGGVDIASGSIESH